VNQLKHIRVVVLDTTQAAMGDLVGVSQATISRWEKGEGSPTRDHLQFIRDEILRRRIQWNDAWFFGGAILAAARGTVQSKAISDLDAKEHACAR
jgi:transcriptional regulator with XRE-family HTH domain